MSLKPILKTDLSTGTVKRCSLDPIIRQRLIDLDIFLDSAVVNAIAHYHSSQVKAALAHVEANFESINSTKAVFLYQLPKQQIELNQSLLPVYFASDFAGFTTEHMKAWYPSHWQQAARHFGIDFES